MALPLNSFLLFQDNAIKVVEVRGVEPLSESTLTGTSPGADDYLHSLARAGTVTLGDLVASLCMARSKLCALTFTTRRRSIPGRGTPGRNGHCLSSDRNTISVVL